MTKSAPFRCLRAVGLPLLVAGLLGMLVAGCGSGGDSTGTISADQAVQASELKAAVEAAGDAYEDQECDLADQKLSDAQGIADGLDIDDTTRANINELLKRLDDLQESCTAQATTTSSTTTSSSESTIVPETTDETDTEATDTDETSTTESTTTSSTTEPSVTTTPPDLPPETTPPGPGGVGGEGEDGGVAPRKTEKGKPGKGPKNGKTPPGQAKKHEKKHEKAKKPKSGGVTP